MGTSTKGSEIVLYTNSQVAEMLGITERTLRSMVKRGDIPKPTVIGARMIRWPSGMVADWIRGGMKPCS